MSLTARAVLAIVLFSALVSADDTLERLAGNWSIAWLAGGHARPVPYTLHVLEGELTLRADAPPPFFVDALRALATRLGVLRPPPLPPCVCAADLLALPAALRVDTFNTQPPQPPRQWQWQWGQQEEQQEEQQEKEQRGALLAPPLRPVGAGGALALRGFWHEWSAGGELLVVLLLRGGGADCAAAFQLRRAAAGDISTGRQMATAVLLVCVAVAKFGGRAFRRGRGMARYDLMANKVRHRMGQQQQQQQQQQQPQQRSQQEERKELMRKVDMLIRRAKQQDERDGNL